jgi:circadian clock protein KaiC
LPGAKRNARSKKKAANGSRPQSAPEALPKVPSGIKGLDDIIGGGLPQGRTTLVCGGPGCGKTLFALEFAMAGALEYGEPAVVMAFEETEADLKINVASLGYDLQKLTDQKKILVDYVHVERSEIEESGEYDLEGLFIRLGQAVDSIRARRVVLDTIEVLFGGFSNAALLRSELRRLFRWLKDRNLTVVITGEQGERTLTRQGLEEYVSDCVILLDHRVTDQISSRRLRVVKYRGSAHGTNEYPFVIDRQGLSVLPITSLGLHHIASHERVSTGISGLDQMLGGAGYYRGSSILVTGTAGSGKTSVAASFVAAACQRGERCLYFAFEESPSQLIRNMTSIGLHLERWLKKGLLQIQAARPTDNGLEMHLAAMHRAVDDFRPSIVVVDPISNLLNIGSVSEVRSMLTRLIDYLKLRQITAIYNSLIEPGGELEGAGVGISSLVDTWLLLQEIEASGERNRGLYVLKSRGMAHSNQIREFRLTSSGIELAEMYLGPGGVLTGPSRSGSRRARRRSGTPPGHRPAAPATGTQAPGA